MLTKDALITYINAARQLESYFDPDKHREPTIRNYWGFMLGLTDLDTALRKIASQEAIQWIEIKGAPEKHLAQLETFPSPGASAPKYATRYKACLEAVEHYTGIVLGPIGDTPNGQPPYKHLPKITKLEQLKKIIKEHRCPEHTR